MNNSFEAKPRFAALIPFFVFIVFYVGLSVWAQDFYKVPMPTAFAVASAAAFFLNRKIPVEEKVNVYASGMGESNIMLMCLIFILAGAFAAVARAMGAVDAAVLITRSLIPARFLLSGIFVVSALISLAIGTSCGTIAALTPIAAGLITPMGIRPEVMLGAVIGGAMFGDNLSMISDTTIAATRTQGVSMRDKFWINIRWVLPAALLSVIWYWYSGKNAVLENTVNPAATGVMMLAVIPYFLVLLLALFGINVLALLFFGIVLAGLIGMMIDTLSFWEVLELCGKGTLGMAETLIVAILAGGLLKVIRYNGGIAWLMQMIERRISGVRGCETGIAFLTMVINLFTANNTVAIVIAGPIARELSVKYRCSPKRVAGILDTASCVVQGLIPYGAQMLIAIGIAASTGVKVSSVGLLGKMIYPALMGIMLIAAILLQRRKK